MKSGRGHSVVQFGEKKVGDASSSSMTSSRGTALEHKWMEWICIRENSDWTLGKDSSLEVSHWTVPSLLEFKTHLDEAFNNTF